MHSADDSREGALNPLARRLSGVALRRTGLATALWGEAGIGKTHASRELLRGLTCRSVSVHAAATYTSVVLTLPRPRKLSLWLEQTLGRLQSGQNEPADPVAVVAALLAANAPFVFQIEDLHEASEERSDFWRKLASVVTRVRGVALLATSRTQPPDSFVAVRLPPLSRSGSDTLLETEAGASLPAEALVWLFDRAAGNPLFTLEFFRLLARQGSLWNDGHLWHWRAPRRETMPVTVEAVIEQALMELDQSVTLRQVVTAQAMLLSGDTVGLLAAMVNLSPEVLAGAQSELERRGVFSRCQFAHPLYREVALSTLGPEQRQVLARRALAALKDAPESAARFIGDARLLPGEALAILQRAVRAAAAAGRTAGAAWLLASAADHAEGEDRARLALQAARGLEAIQPAETLRLARLAAEGQRPDAEAVFYLAGRLVQRHRRLADADEVLGQLPAEVRRSATWTAWQISFLTACGQFPEALDLWAERPDLPDRLDPATLYSVAGCLIHTGQPDRAAELAQQGLALADLTPIQRTQLLNVLSIACAVQGRSEDAETHLSSALDLARSHGLTQLLGALLQNRAKNLDRTERYADALEAAREAYQAYGEAGDGPRQANVGTMVAAFLTEFGRYVEAEAILLDSVALFERQEPSRFLVLARLTLVHLYLDWQPPHGAVLALKMARNARDQAGLLGQMPDITALALAGLARAEARTDDAHTALAHAREAVTLARPAADESTFLSLAALGTAHAALGQTEAAILAWEEAAQAAATRGFTLDARRHALEAARLTGDVVVAREHCAWFEARGLLNGANLARRYFPELARHQLAARPAPRIRLDLLGDLCCSQGGVSRPVRGRKRQELLGLLAEARLAGRAGLSRLDLLDALYRNTAEPQANAALHDLVHQVRADLGPSTILTNQDGHALGEVALDAEDFLSGGDTRLWRGPYLSGLELEPQGPARDALYLALRARTETLLSTNPAEAVRLGRLLLEADPYDQGSLRLILMALRANQNHRSLGRVYSLARARLLDVGERLPEGWADFLTLSTSPPIGTMP